MRQDTRQLIDRAIRDNPGVRFAVGGTEDSAVAYWDESLGWRMVAGRLIDGTWARIPNLYANGKLAVSDWREVAHA